MKYCFEKYIHRLNIYNLYLMHLKTFYNNYQNVFLLYELNNDPYRIIHFPELQIITQKFPTYN